jgi:hypothetical protein
MLVLFKKDLFQFSDGNNAELQSVLMLLRTSKPSVGIDRHRITKDHRGKSNISS